MAERPARNIRGDRLFEQRARLALPVLVRQAQLGSVISYQDLARMIGMPNPRNLNHPLHVVGLALDELSEQWRTEIPHIQSLVVRKKSTAPGSGFATFARDSKAFANGTDHDRETQIQPVQDDVFAYQHWNSVLKALGLSLAA